MPEIEVIDDAAEENAFDSDLEDEDGDDDRPFFGRRPGTRENKDDVPLTNSETIPLLPNANKKEAREAVAMKVIKLNQPNAGFKGEIHIGADEDYIANLYGDGIYTVEFINSKKKVIKKREGIRIAVGMNNDNPRDPGPDNRDNLDALRLAHISHNMERKRTENLSQSVINTTRDLATQHTQMVVESSKASAIRDREFYSGQSTSMQSFFASILQQQQIMADNARQQSEQAHRQQMEASERSNNQMLIMMDAMHTRSMESNNPMMLLNLFKQGMDMGRDIGGDDSEPWERAIKTGVEGLGQLATMQRMSLQTPRQLPSKQTIKNPRPQQNPPVTKPPTETNQETPVVNLKEIDELKAICDKRGIDFDNIIKEAREYLEKASDSELDESSNETEPNNQSS
jgi:hypothetical protein